MIRGLYTSALGMNAAQTQSEIIGDNIANVQTPGYKEQVGVAKAFPTILVERIGANSEPSAVPIGAMGTGVSVNNVALTNVMGALQTTGKKTDFALTTLGYFVVQTPGGDRYTRDGHFQINSQGMLQTPDGYPVLGQNGPVGPLTANFTVSSKGTITDNGKTVDQLRVVQIPANALQRQGQSLYSATQPAQATAAPGSINIVQGSVEASNVDISGQMVQMITVMKAYEANQKVIQTEDNMLNEAANQVGKI